MKKIFLPILLAIFCFTAFISCSKEVKAPTSQSQSTAVTKNTNTNTSTQPTQTSNQTSPYGGGGCHHSSTEGGGYSGGH